MYNNEDRSWMYDRVRSGGYPNQSFIDGVYRFVAYASSQTNNQGKVTCPCKKCCNCKFHTTDEITWHLYSRGFLPDYYVWIAHGEFFPNRTEASSSYVPLQSPVHESFGGHYREMVDDAFGGRYEHINFNQGVNEEPSPEVRAFYELLQRSETRLSCGNREIALEFISKFMTDKIMCNTTAASCDKWLKQFHTTLSPEDRLKIPKDVKRMKRALRNLGLEKKTYDLCENDCFLFYGVYEASSITHCPVCNEERFEPTRSANPRSKRIPKKKLWYFPLTARLQRLYMSRATSEHMTWHLKCRGQNDTMIHPAGGEAWKSFDDEYPDYAAEPRSVRLDMCTDGFTPWGRFGNSYSCWPVFVTPYNLPPDMCMRQEYIFLSLLIPGPGSPGKNLDVMLRPIIDELCSLWKNGAQTYDSFRKQNFVMRAHLMWTISDFPAYGMLSQWSTHGGLSCPYCMEETKSFRLEHGRKPCWFDCHRRFLPDNHHFRWNTTNFRKGRDEFDAPLVRRSGEEMEEIVSYLPYIEFGNTGQRIEGFGVKHNWCRRSIFWELPYWKSNLIRQNLDVMHCEKNFFDNIKNTVMDDPEKTKDNLNSRKDLEKWTTRSDLFPILGRNRQHYKRKAKYCLSKEQKLKVCEWVSGIKFPDGYASNISRCAQIPQLRLTGLKSHDCHVFMQRLLPIAFRDFLDDPIWEPITEISIFFRSLCATELSKHAMEQLEESIIITMCKLEQIFPPSFFDSMEHLAIHLPWEAKVGGPVQYRWMYPFERRMQVIKKAVKNKAHVEGSIAEEYLISEVTNFLQHYFDKYYETRANRLNRNEVALNEEFNEELSVFHVKGEAIGCALRKRYFTSIEYRAAELYIFLNCPEVEPWLRLFDEQMCVGLMEQQIQTHRNQHFVEWMKGIVASRNFDVDERIISLVKGPINTVRMLDGYLINGFRFHTTTYNNAKKTNNNGVYVKGDDAKIIVVIITCM